MTEPIFREVEHDLLRGWDAFTSHLPHRRYHDPEAAATPATEAPDMSLLTEAKTIFKDGIAKLEGVSEEGAERFEALQGNPVAMEVMDGVASLLHAPDAVQFLSNAAKDLLAMFPKPAAAPAEADPAMGQQPEPVSAS